MGKEYSEAEKEYIREHYPELGAKGCAEVLGRPRNSVQYMAQKLGVRQYVSKPWTDEEIQFLRNNFPSKAGNYCAKALNRSFHAVHKMKEKLGIELDIKGWYIDVQGYKVITPNRETKLYEHRLVMEEELGRPLKSSEIVHHIDGNKKNNHPDNLMIMTRSEHMKEHHEEIVEAKRAKRNPVK